MEPKHTAERGRPNRYTNQGADKLRGGYYTSPEVARWLCKWAIRDGGDRVLEPSCGDGIFLDAALDRLAELGVHPLERVSGNLTGVEAVPEEAERARKILWERFGLDASGMIQTGDFFDSWQKSRDKVFDVVVGNPPFIRYQNFPEPCRSRAMEIMVELGLKPNRLTNIWVPFVAAAATSLSPGGRLALVLPAELLQVSYAAQLRSFLTNLFARINMVTCNELFFNRAEQEVILLLADGALPTPSTDNSCRVAMAEAHTVSEIVGRHPDAVIAQTPHKPVRHSSEKWLKYFLTGDEILLMRELRRMSHIASLRDYADVDVGVVTGNNSFFVLDGGTLSDLDLREYAIPLVSRSEQLRGARLSRGDWQSLDAAGSRVHLLHLSPLNGKQPKAPLERYIRIGEERGVHEGYKCSVRSPWYAVPSTWEPQGFMFRQIYDFPRVVLNDTVATSTDTIHRMRFKANPEQTVASAYTYLTAASAEIEGRSYGGGVLELEPTEAERLLMPGILEHALPVDECDRLLRSGRLGDLLSDNSRAVLVDGLGLSEAECLMLRNIWAKMRTRRLSRRRRNTSAGA